jgi:hypothetical protein
MTKAEKNEHFEVKISVRTQLLGDNIGNTTRYIGIHDMSRDFVE